MWLRYKKGKWLVSLKQTKNYDQSHTSNGKEKWITNHLTIKIFHTKDYVKLFHFPLVDWWSNSQRDSQINNFMIEIRKFLILKDEWLNY